MVNGTTLVHLGIGWLVAGPAIGTLLIASKPDWSLQTYMASFTHWRREDVPVRRIRAFMWLGIAVRVAAVAWLVTTWMA